MYVWTSNIFKSLPHINRFKSFIICSSPAKQLQCRDLRDCKKRPGRNRSRACICAAAPHAPFKDFSYVCPPIVRYFILHLDKTCFFTITLPQLKPIQQTKTTTTLTTAIRACIFCALAPPAHYFLSKISLTFVLELRGVFMDIGKYTQLISQALLNVCLALHATTKPI